MTDATLTIDQLRVAYDGRVAVGGVRLRVPRRGIVTLLGPNGAGKSSLVNGVAGIVAAEGVLSVGEVTVPLGDPEAVRRAGVAAVPEGHRVLTELTVRENLAVASSLVPRSRRREAVDGALNHFPELAPLLERSAGALSGGEQQMLAIAQALVISPRFLVVDELSLGLAPVVVRRLAVAMTSIAEAGAGILIIEQFTQLALSLASYAYVMTHGVIVHEGETGPLRADPSLLAGHYLAAGDRSFAGHQAT